MNFERSNSPQATKIMKCAAHSELNSCSNIARPEKH